MTRTSRRPLRGTARIVAAVVVIACVASCDACKTDAQRAADERAKIDAVATDAWALLPYRSLKALTRSKASPSRPKEFDEVDAAYARVAEPPKTLAQSKDEAEAYATLAVALVKVRRELKSHDEDEFPLLWSALDVKPDPPAFYDNGLEHLGLASAYLLFDVADRSNRTPAVDVEFYELSRARPSFQWPWALRAWTLGARGAAFFFADYHYAAEEELTSFLRELDDPHDETDVVLGALHASSTEALEAMRAAGHLVRAYNRTALGRTGGAVDDVDAALVDLDKLGVDDEVTTWCHAFVAVHRGHTDDAVRALDKLANDGFVADSDRARLQEAAAKVRAGGTMPVALEGRAALMLTRALIARNGGLEAVVAKLAGADAARRIHAPLEAIERVQHNVRAHLPALSN